MKAKRVLPVYRIYNREENLDFFRNVLGMKVLLEEGAMVELGGHQAQETRILLEETPEENYHRPADRIKRHKHTVLFAPAGEVQELLEKNGDDICPIVYEDARGFRAVSPDGDVFFLVESDSFGEECEKSDVVLSDFSVAEVVLNVDSVMTAEQDFSVINEISEEFKLTFEQREIDKGYVWDIEAFQILLPKEADFNEELVAGFAAFNPYLDAGHDLLSVSLPEGIELWFGK